MTLCKSQGVGYPLVYRYISACVMFHCLFGLAHSDPSIDAVCLTSVKELSDGYITQHTSLLDVLEDCKVSYFFFTPFLCRRPNMRKYPEPLSCVPTVQFANLSHFSFVSVDSLQSRP